MSYGSRYSGKGYGNYGSFKPAPVEEGEEYEADITDLGRRGDGIAKIQGFIVFVPDTKPGDHVKFKVKTVARRHAIAEKVQ